MYCRNCGNQVDGSIEECNICGQNIHRGQNYCPVCGHFCIPGDTTCIQCKSPLTENVKLSVTINKPADNQTSPIPDVNINPNANTSGHSTVVPPVEPQISAQTQQSATTSPKYDLSGPKYLPAGKKYCRNCGLVINADADVCPFCDSPHGQGHNYCSKCGSGTIEGDSVCSVCSNPLTRVQPTYIPKHPPVKTSNNQNQQRNQYTQQQVNPNQRYNGAPYNVNIQNNYNYNYNPNSNVGEHSYITTILLSLLGFLGFCGIHRFYTKDYLIGILQLVTFGGCYIWQIIDFILIISDSYRDGDGKKLSKN